MIDKKLILKNAPSNTGEQIHVNHEGCPSGKDNKRRLYIKKTATSLLAYCHHCNKSGFVNFEGSRLSTWINPTTKATRTNALPTLVELSIHGKMWLAKHYCDSTEHCFNGIQGKPYQVCLDLMDADRNVIGYQIRNLLPNAVPKYLTQYFSSDGNQDCSWFYNNSKTLIITEDYLSAYRVHANTPHSAVALLRTTISDSTLIKINELGFDKIFIWLDPDDAGVGGTTKVYKKLSHFLPNETLIVLYGMDKEPKQCTPEELRSLLV